MIIRTLYSFFLLMTLSSPSRADLSHRLAAHVGGLYVGMGYGFSTGALYQMAFHRNFALEFNGNYNSGAFALGNGPIYSGGLDISLQAMLYNYGITNLSKGVGIGLGVGTHYLVDINKNKFLEKKGDVYFPKKGTFLLVPLSLEIFYQHTFDNDLFIKTGFKVYLAQYSHQFEGPKIDASSVEKIVPSLYFGIGYSF